jgi:drug/metabolite transporter (DMT)-like permease
MTGELSALGAALCWTISSILLKNETDKLDGLSINALNCVFAALVFPILSLALGKFDLIAHISGLSLVYLVSSVLVGIGIGDTFFLTSLPLVGVSRALTISNIHPLFSATLALILLHERPSWWAVGGIALTVTGIGLVSSWQNETSTSLTSWLNLGLPLLAAICWAASMTILRVGVQGIDNIAANTVRMPSAALVLTVLVLRRGNVRRISSYGWRSLSTVALASLVGACVGSLLFLSALQKIELARAATLASTSPLWALPLSALFLGEKITAKTIFGTILSVAGIWLILSG